MKLHGAVVLITGGASGLGAACAEEMRRRGAVVSIADLKSPVSSISSEMLSSCGDIVEERFREEVLQRTLDRYGKIDVLINNAGVGLYSYAQDAPMQAARRLFEVNVFASLAMAQLVIPVFQHQHRGVIVNIGSIGGEVALPWASLYCASKFSLHCVSESLRRELKRSGIRVITVKPGIVATGFRQNVLGGTAPARVNSLDSMDPESLARTIANKIEGRGSTVFKPWYGRIFAFVSYVAPWVIDMYVQYASSNYASINSTQYQVKTSASARAKNDPLVLG